MCYFNLRPNFLIARNAIFQSALKIAPTVQITQMIVSLCLSCSENNQKMQKPGFLPWPRVSGRLD